MTVGTEPTGVAAPTQLAQAATGLLSKSVSLEALTKEHQTEVVTGILDSGAGMCAISEKLAMSKGLTLQSSPNLARLGNGAIVNSKGTAYVFFKFKNTSKLSDSCRLQLEALGFNDSLLISRTVLTKWKFRFFDSDSDEYGSYLITPSWHWYPLRVEGGATVCSFRMSIEENTLCLTPISNIPPVHVDISRALGGLLDTSPDSDSQSDALPLNSMDVLEGAAVQQYNYEIGLYSDSVAMADSESLIEHVMTHSDSNPSCCVDSETAFNLSTMAVNQSLRKFNKQQLHEIFGHCSDVTLNSLLDGNNLMGTKLTKSMRRKKCKCSSCLRGFHP